MNTQVSAEPVEQLMLDCAVPADGATAMDVSSTVGRLILVWRPVSDPIALGRRRRLPPRPGVRYTEPGPWAALAGVPAVLHGINDWVASDLDLAWVLITVVSTLLFLAYARVGIAAASPRPAWPARPVADPPTMPIRVVAPGPVRPGPW